jgi:hypothetical protein
MSEKTQQPGHTANRLIHEKSPYLLQHAHNPVDWHPWGLEAIEKAHKEDKPIFLSIGYSTCYWCHVMEREVFENEELASLMNKDLICIKVDREERPDIDRVYMMALQGMSGSGGWPMSMFLGHDLKPFFGATYIPPRSQYGRAGFGEVLERINDTWRNNRGQIVQISERMGEFLSDLAKSEGQNVNADGRVFEIAYELFLKSYDEQNAGFGGAPKFPRAVAYNFLLRHYKRTGKENALSMVLQTLQRMAGSGMYDHIGGGFHRYATDERWHVPHFEKMLYDQAQLVVSYLEAYQITQEESYADVARDVLLYVQRFMTHPQGGFYSAEDAESATDAQQPGKKEEGAFYVWTADELKAILSPGEREVFFRTYGVEESGNVIADPHGVFRGKNILHLMRSENEIAQQTGLSPEEVGGLLASARTNVFAAREKRPKPHLDDKILVSWNGLMISAYARAFQVLGDEQYLAAATQSARFILEKLADSSTGLLLRRYRDGEARFEANLEDYAFFVQGLIDLYEASFESGFLQSAIALTDRQVQRFFDRDDGGFFDTSGNDKTVIIKTKEWYDGAEPSGNSVALLNLLRLAHITGRPEYDALARKSLTFFGRRMIEAPQTTPQFLVALDFSLSRPKEIVVAGRTIDPETRAIVQEIHKHFIPNKILLLADGSEEQTALETLIPFLSGKVMIEGKPTAYVCENYACRLPTSDLSVLRQLLVQQKGPDTA